MRALLLSALLSASAALATPLPPKSSFLVENLPGAPSNLTFQQYAGCLPIDGNGKKADAKRCAFFWYTECADGNPEDAPLVLWLQGGPGCSSLVGFTSENGAFSPIKNGTELALNPYSWNTKANMLYLEAPLGVGFSRSSDPADYVTGDAETAEGNYQALQLFFEVFPELRNHMFFLTGESYAGHYIPTLSRRILQANAEGKDPTIHLMGFADGNPLLDVESNYVDGTWPTWASHALISDEVYQNIHKECHNPLSPSKACQAFLTEAQDQMGSVNPYDILVDVCKPGTPSKQRLVESMNALVPGMRAGLSGRSALSAASSSYNPCEDNVVSNYLNRLDVQKALHAVDADAAAPLKWVECSSVVQYNQTDLTQSMLPIITELFNAQVTPPPGRADGAHEGDPPIYALALRMLIYSGDVDTVCPFSATQLQMSRLGRKTIAEWHPWLTSPTDFQVAGYATQYDGIIFATVRGAGHMVPEFQPARGLALFERFLGGNDFDPY